MDKKVKKYRKKAKKKLKKLIGKKYKTILGLFMNMPLSELVRIFKGEITVEMPEK